MKFLRYRTGEQTNIVNLKWVQSARYYADPDGLAKLDLYIYSPDTERFADSIHLSGAEANEAAHYLGIDTHTTNLLDL